MVDIKFKAYYYGIHQIQSVLLWYTSNSKRIIMVDIKFKAYYYGRHQIQSVLLW